MAKKTRTEKHSSIKFSTSRQICAITFILPWIIGFLLFFMIPLYHTIIYSLNTIGVGERGGITMSFVGFQNYIALFQDEVSTNNLQFLRVFSDENIRIFIYTPITVIFSLFSAILINVNFKGRGLARVIFFLPIIIGLDVVLNLMSVTTGGDLVDSSIGAFFSEGFIMEFLLEHTFLPLRVTAFIDSLTSNIFDLISKCGVQTLIFLAGLQSIPGALYEVAKIEGCNVYETFWKITLPMLGNIMIFALVYSFVDLFLSSVIAEEIYSFAFRRNNIGMGSALSVVYMINVLAALGLFSLLFAKVAKIQND